ncbi:MAG: putative lipoprotein [bacterium]
MRSVLVATFGTVAVLIGGCSISESIKSSSDSSASSSRSSSSSSGAQRQSYINEVRDYTDAYAKSTAQIDGFTRGLANIASKHGISDWESDMDSFTGIGAGLKKAAVKPPKFEVWKQNLTSGDASKGAAMQQGYDAQQ